MRSGWGGLRWGGVGRGGVGWGWVMNEADFGVAGGVGEGKAGEGE